MLVSEAMIICSGLQDPVIPSPTPTPKSMLNAALYLQGPNIWSALALFSEFCHARSYVQTCLCWLYEKTAAGLKMLSCRPLTTDKLIMIVDSLADTMTTIQASDVNVLNVAKVLVEFSFPYHYFAKWH